MEMAVSERDAIENALYRFGWSFAMADRTGLEASFSRDAEVTFDVGLTKVGRTAVVAEVMRRREAYVPRAQMLWHVLTNVYVEQTAPDQARVRSYFTALVTGESGAPALQSLGYYADDFVLEEGDWRIAKRRIVRAPLALAELGGAATSPGR
jgi:SnoaL-like protein